ncbi:MAG TPA: hydroxymyristoyl-ACP dehydratase [Variovorax sp.]|nr:hydroxymyristoyl-ACP dehydratase [Variovorax sp.]
MMPGRAQIETLVPHAGAMCLLDAVTAWDASHIACSSAGPGPGHPLARDGRVPAIAACEYAAQAVAVHGALLDGVQDARDGMLAKLADVDLRMCSFPSGAAQVTVHAELLGRLATGCLYAFDVASAGQAVASGRLIVAFTTPEAP